MGGLAYLPQGRRNRVLLALAAALVLAGVALDWRTSPPKAPDFAELAGSWKSSEAWLYDKDGGLLDELRVDFAMRRLAWTPLSAISQNCAATLWQPKTTVLPATAESIGWRWRDRCAAV